MELPLEVTKSKQRGGRSRRRSSLFLVKETDNSFCGLDDQHSYPPEYIEKLKTESEIWGREIAKYHSGMLEKNRKLSSEKLQDSHILDKEQLDFLSSLPDYTEYLQCVVDFNNKFEIAAVMVNSNKEELEEMQREMKDIDEKILGACKRFF